MISYYDRWADEGDQWLAIFGAIDPLLDDFAQHHGMTITAWRWDAPDRLLSWIGGDGLERNIQLSLVADRSWQDESQLVPQNPPTSYELHFGGAAWKDSGRQRLLHQEAWPDLTAGDVSEKNLPSSNDIKSRLDRAYGYVAKWTVANLETVIILP